MKVENSELLHISTHIIMYLFACVLICTPVQFINNSYVLHKSEYFLSANSEESNKTKS